MVELHEEKVNCAIDGTIIDIETIGDFSAYVSDSKRCMKKLPNGKYEAKKYAVAN